MPPARSKSVRDWGSSSAGGVAFCARATVIPAASTRAAVSVDRSGSMVSGGGLGPARTGNPRLRRAVLYPVELRDQRSTSKDITGVRVDNGTTNGQRRQQTTAPLTLSLSPQRRGERGVGLLV